MPESYTWISHLTTLYRSLDPLTKSIPEIPNVSSESIALHVLFLQAGCVSPEMLVPILVITRYTQDLELQDACIRALSSAPIDQNWLYMNTILSDWDMLEALFNRLYPADKYTSTVVVFYFRLLVAGVMLYDKSEFSHRQSTLRDMLSNSERFKDLSLAYNGGIRPAQEQILEHVAEHTGDIEESTCMLRTMELVVDFCHAELEEHQPTEPELLEPDQVPEWVIKLQAIKDNFKPS
ncbi:hypothetical protein RhiJN_07813 [Ceratobasidium sp. AG-Ba]|nr:hypothetical protein RhiJN_07813 [Ceratobasidium sp. AG-Ba]